MIEKLLIGTLNLNDLLVTLETDNTSPGGAPGGKVPGSQKRCEHGHTVMGHFSRGDQRIMEDIISFFKYCLRSLRAFLAGTGCQGFEKEKDTRMIVSLCIYESKSTNK